MLTKKDNEMNKMKKDPLIIMAEQAGMARQGSGMDSTPKPDTNEAQIMVQKTKSRADFIDEDMLKKDIKDLEQIKRQQEEERAKRLLERVERAKRLKAEMKASKQFKKDHENHMDAGSDTTHSNKKKRKRSVRSSTQENEEDAVVIDFKVQPNK